MCASLTGGPLAGGCAAFEAAPAAPPPPSRWYLSRLPLSPCTVCNKHIGMGSAARIRKRLFARSRIDMALCTHVLRYPQLQLQLQHTAVLAHSVCQCSGGQVS